MTKRPEYQTFYDNFDVTILTDSMRGDFSTGVNVCVECCDRYVGQNRVALEWRSESGEGHTYTFEELQVLSAKVANLLVTHGVRPGDRVAGLLPRIPELVALVLGVLRAGGIYQPLFTAFGPKAIEHRLTTSQASIVVTNPANRSKLDGIANQITVMCIDGQDGDIDFTAGISEQSETFVPVMRSGDDGFLMMATSGTTGPPKCLKVPVRGLAGIAGYMKYGLDLRTDDVFWNIADPGWAYGLYYGVIGPLLLGHQTTFYEGAFTVESTAALVQELGVTNFAGAPTAYRMIIAQGPDAAKPLAEHLRIASSAGEPLNP
ncbi:MAG: AMP-binding protein, partial [Hyphomicrobiales bacterium]|nr:AMP-binding protein [Hyphomicrobiales bacterium]